MDFIVNVDQNNQQIRSNRLLKEQHLITLTAAKEKLKSEKSEILAKLNTETQTKGKR